MPNSNQKIAARMHEESEEEEEEEQEEQKVDDW